MQLATERLIIRPILLDDAAAVFKYRCDKETNQYQGWIPETVDDVVTFIGKVAKQFNVPETWFQMVIVERESKNIIGDIGIHFLDDDQVEIGCTLDVNKQAKGYATEALRAAFNHLFKELGKHRITASIDPANTKSIALVQRLGFRKEAHFVESLWMNGVWVDDVVFAILKREWA
ncbi:GNAT family N-acetyltransferase [Labilibacter marinus]|uniref:GNAT family N-acetyltransferase n=1 Tax=Labilibacter marinus TaxID=1477105 RepID=UPI000832060E|nr:GNAT family protein [Labilibacter marinus]